MLETFTWYLIHHHQVVILAQFSPYVHKGRLNPHLFIPTRGYFINCLKKEHIETTILWPVYIASILYKAVIIIQIVPWWSFKKRNQSCRPASFINPLNAKLGI